MVSALTSEFSFFEQLLRIAAIYFFTLIMLRIAGKRRVARLSAFDLLIIISLGSAVGDVMLYSENVVSLFNGMAVVFSVIAFQILITKLTEHNRRLGYLIYGKGTEMIRNGRVLRKNLEDEDLTEDELSEMLREKGVGSPSEVSSAFLERSGELGIIPFGKGRANKQASMRRRSPI